MVYNFNLGIGWASSGVEYAQAYRCKVLRALHIPAKFIFTDMFRQENIEHMSRNIGFRDEEVIWLYQYFTDFHTAPTTFTRQALEETFAGTVTEVREENGKIVYVFGGQNMRIQAYLVGNGCVFKAEYVSAGYMIRTDYYSYARMFSEFFTPKDDKAVLHLRRFYNEDGSDAYEEIIEGDKEFFRIGADFFYSKEQFFRHMVRSLPLTADDVVIADRTTKIGQALFAEHGPARLGIVIHADHFNEHMTDDANILWNNYYEYDFSHAKDVAFFIASTKVQQKLLEQQFAKYYGWVPRIVTIPVGSLKELKRPSMPRRRHAALTASRLATEKHVDWLVRAVVKARREVPDLTFDIYGKGGEEEHIRKEIAAGNAESYIRLCGHRDLTDVYTQYEAYLSASGSEGFGLTLLEAVGSGLPLIGFDVRYGNQTFIRDGENGYLLPKGEQSIEELTDLLAESIVKLFTEADLNAFEACSYEIAEPYLDEHVAERWKKLLCGERKEGLE